MAKHGNVNNMQIHDRIQMKHGKVMTRMNYYEIFVA
jgi:hypothetical protein